MVACEENKGRKKSFHTHTASIPAKKKIWRAHNEKNTQNGKDDKNTFVPPHGVEPWTFACHITSATLYD
jgi:hypothetical protein